jgi:GcrA cell cycle regulator
MTALAWTIPEIETLTRDWLAGLSATLIGLKLQRSRNSVAGKVHRLGLPLGTTQRVKATAPATPKPESKPKPVAKKPDPAPLPPSKPVRLFDLRRKHCRALLDTSDDRNPLFCGAPVVRGERGQRTSYCAKHHRLFHKRCVP